MRLLPADERGVQRALELAREAAAFASPNPTVGCVLLGGDQTLGEGAHHYQNYDHAEIVALKQARAAGHDVSGTTACVTLEPCSHHGRTGPCSDALIAARIRRCVVATVDPNPLVSGQGLARLRAAGVDVLLLAPADELAQEARRLNDAFAFSVQHGRPMVTLKAALSVDGKLAPAPSRRTSAAPQWLTGPAAREDVHRLRHSSDAILTGIGTVLADDPELTDRSRLPRGRALLRVVLDGQLRIPLDSKLVRSAGERARTRDRDSDLLILCTDDARSEKEAELLSRGTEVVRVRSSSAGLDLHSVLAVLNDRRIRSALIEGGSALNGAVLRAELADKVVLYFAESELGRDALPFARGAESPYTLQQQLTSVERVSFPHDRAGSSEDIRITGYLHEPWTDI